MVLREGEKLQVITRRWFDTDLRLRLVGEVQAVSEVAVRVEGYLFVFDAGSNRWVKRPDRRVRVVGLADSGSEVYVLPAHLDINDLSYQTTSNYHVVLTDNKGFSMEINEFSAIR